MVNSNLYEDQPYLPPRDPRELNVIERLKDLSDNEPVFVDDEELQRSDFEKEVSVIVEKVVNIHINNETPPGEGEGGNTGGSEGGIIYQSAIISAPTQSDFPAVGSEELLYLATEENGGAGYIYRWCSEQGCYLRPEDSVDNISLIEGGNAFSGTL